MKPTTDELIKLNKAYYLKVKGEFSKRIYYWDNPKDLIEISLLDINRFKSFIGFGKWKNSNKVYICLVKKGTIIYLERNTLELIIRNFKQKEEIAKIKEVLK